MTGRAFVVHAHPEPASFTAAMRDTVVATLETRGYAVVQSDLYAMDFDPVASAGDFASRADPDYLVYALEQRHAWRGGALAADIRRELDKLFACDLLVLTFPLFWFSVPAILKGWIDRVFLSGPVYGGRRIFEHGGLRGKRAMVAFSMGGRAHMFGEGSLHGPLETGMLRHLLRGTLAYTGLAVHRPFAAHHVPYIDDAARRAILDRLAAYTSGLESVPLVETPDLADFDETFAPRPEGRPLASRS